MTEFSLSQGAVLGLMPEHAIKTLLGPALPDPMLARGIARAELYLLVDAPDAYHARALKAGAKELSALSPRDWGHTAAYCLDMDGHVLAFAAPTPGRQPDTDLGFDYRERKGGVVELTHHGRPASTLRGHDATDFLDAIRSCTPTEAQQLMARITGNFKRGNERLAANHPRNRR
jgi:hypothetical protein